MNCLLNEFLNFSKKFWKIRQLDKRRLEDFVPFSVFVPLSMFVPTSEPFSIFTSDTKHSDPEQSDFNLPTTI